MDLSSCLNAYYAITVCPPYEHLLRVERDQFNFPLYLLNQLRNLACRNGMGFVVSVTSFAAVTLTIFRDARARGGAEV